MVKYPIDITDKENASLKYPFLPTEQYESVHRLPDGPLILIRRSEEKLTKEDIVHMVSINRQIAAHRILNEQEN